MQTRRAAALPGSRQAGVGDVARQRVLDRILAVTRNRGAGATADEVALLEHLQIRFSLLNELVDRPRPEDPADHGGSLQGLLLRRIEQIDSRRDDGLHSVWDGEVGG